MEVEAEVGASMKEERRPPGEEETAEADASTPEEQSKPREGARYTAGG